jgi:hypothetical protein
MKRYLEVTYRAGKPIAAYLYLPRSKAQRSARTEQAAPGLLIDFAESGEPIGLEITAPSVVTVQQVNTVLAGLHLDPITEDEFRPLKAA